MWCKATLGTLERKELRYSRSSITEASRPRGCAALRAPTTWGAHAPAFFAKEHEKLHEKKCNQSSGSLRGLQIKIPLVGGLLGGVRLDFFVKTCIYEASNLDPPVCRGAR